MRKSVGSASHGRRPSGVKFTTQWLLSCKSHDMILLVTPAQSAPDCAHALDQAVGEAVTISRDFSEALTHVRTSAFSMVILDRNLLEAERLEASTLWAHMESTTVVELNLALTGVDRLIREVRSTRKCLVHNQAVARENARRMLHGEINQALTGLLLECDLAARIRGLPCSTSERIASIRMVAEKLRQQLTPSSTN